MVRLLKISACLNGDLSKFRPPARHFFFGFRNHLILLEQKADPDVSAGNLLSKMDELLNGKDQDMVQLKATLRQIEEAANAFEVVWNESVSMASDALPFHSDVVFEEARLTRAVEEADISELQALARHLGTTDTGTSVMAGLASEIPAYAEISRRIQQAELAEERRQAEANAAAKYVELLEAAASSDDVAEVEEALDASAQVMQSATSPVKAGIDADAALKERLRLARAQCREHLQELQAQEREERRRRRVAEAERKEAERKEKEAKRKKVRRQPLQLTASWHPIVLRLCRLPAQPHLRSTLATMRLRRPPSGSSARRPRGQRRRSVCAGRLMRTSSW